MSALEVLGICIIFIGVFVLIALVVTDNRRR